MLDTVESVHVTVDGLRQLGSTIFRSGGSARAEADLVAHQPDTTSVLIPRRARIRVLGLGR